MYSFAKSFMIMSAVALRYNNGCTNRQAVAQTDQGIADSTCTADSRQCFLTNKLTDHNSIHSVVQLLKDKSKHCG